jgi:hypothetical protein
MVETHDRAVIFVIFYLLYFIVLHDLEHYNNDNNNNNNNDNIKYNYIYTNCIFLVIHYVYISIHTVAD